MADMVVIAVVIVLMALGWFLCLDGRAALRGRRCADEPGPFETAPDVVPSDFGRWPANCGTAAEGREAALTRQLFSGAIDPAAYRRLMAELARSDARPTERS